MKMKIMVFVIVLCLALPIATPAFAATSGIAFTAINDTLKPLSNETMPAIIGSLLYIPCSFFSTDELGVYCILGGSQVMLYNSSKRLIFDTKQDTVIDQDNNEHSTLAVVMNGLIYVPVDDVCAFFGLTYDVIQSALAPVVRFINGPIIITKDKFTTLYKNKMQMYYDTYIGDSTTQSVSPSSSAPTTFENVTVYLSFYELSGGKLESVLNTLAPTYFKACFFVTADEIAENAGLLRHAAGNGHTIGILLTDGTADGVYTEYQAASALLFEATKVKTVIVTAVGDNAKTAEDAALAESLVFWRPTKNYDGKARFSAATLTDKLSTIAGMRESLYFACSDDTADVLRSFLSYLQHFEYNMRRVTETSIPVRSA